VFGIVGYVRQLLTRARQLSTSGAAPSPEDADAAEFIPYVEGRRRIIAHVQNDAQVGDALDLADEFGLELILCGLTRIDTSLERIAAAKVPVVVGIMMEAPRTGKRFDHVFRLPGRLAALGISVSIATFDAMPGGVRNLPYAAGLAVSFGLSHEDALKAITLAPAQAFGVEGELGSLEIGKIGNVVIADGDPLEVTTQVTQVFVRGEALPMTSRQTRLRDRYDIFGTRKLPGGLGPEEPRR
jgi:imidazolonepropionase-like amidohydrolase